MRVLVTGANGQVGRDAQEELRRRGHEVCATTRAEFDITDEGAVSAFVEKIRPDAILHCAAYTAVDKAESEIELCERVNVLGTRYLAGAAKRMGAKFLYLSTDYVFDGKKEGAYLVEDKVCPLSVYGRSKARGEEEVKSLLEKYFIVRISWVYGENGKNFVKTMLSLSETRNALSVVCDQVGSPTYTKDLSPLLCDMLESEKYGTYHATGEEFCSWYDFAAEIFRLTDRSVKLTPVTSEEYFKMQSGKIAPRPKNSRLDKSKLKSCGFAPLPPWQDALKRFLKYRGEI